MHGTTVKIMGLVLFTDIWCH